MAVIIFEMGLVLGSPLALLVHFARHFVSLLSSALSNSMFSRAFDAKMWITSSIQHFEAH